MAVFISSLKIYPPYVDDEMSTFIRLDIGQDAHFRSYISKDIKTWWISQETKIIFLSSVC